MLSLTDPVVEKYFVAGDNGTWRCKSNGVILQNANLNFYRSYGGPAMFGLPLTNEIYLSAYPNTAIVPCERAIICYDPSRKIDNPPIGTQSYLMHINLGVGQQMIAKALVDPLNVQISTLKSQLSTTQSQLTTLQSQLKAAQADLAEAQDTSALEQQIATLQSQATTYQSQIATIQKQVATYQNNLKQIAQLATV